MPCQGFRTTLAAIRAVQGLSPADVNTVTNTCPCTRRKCGRLLPVAMAAGGDGSRRLSFAPTLSAPSARKADATSRQRSLTIRFPTAETRGSSGTGTTGSRSASPATTRKQETRTAGLPMGTEAARARAPGAVEISTTGVPEDRRSLFRAKTTVQTGY